MAYLKLVASLIFFTTAFTAFGIAAAHDKGHNPWSGAIVGGLVGILFGLICGGGLNGTKLLDAIYPPNPNSRPENDE